ncbi:MAG: Fe-S-containing hydro-lyase [Erysipelotrichaceae bacterium]|nr:Fe-S-containing hydro-lyase [Erysipelotrichaceae bacterium]
MKKLQLPLDETTRMSLRAGEVVYLTGVIYTARDAAHKKMKETLDRGEELPFDLKDQMIYYVGPTQAKPDQAIGSAGPTTAGRMDVYTPQLLDLGLKGMIGKGYRTPAVKEAIVRNKAVYFIAAGGAGALLSQCIKKAEMVAYPELLSEAIRRLEVVDFPVFVGIDTLGNDIYEEDK